MAIGLGLLPFWSVPALALWAGEMVTIWGRQGCVLLRNRDTWQWLLLTAGFLWSTWQSPAPREALLGLGNFVPFFAFFLALRPYLTPTRLQVLLTVMASTGVAVTAIGLLQATFPYPWTLTLLGVEMNWHPRIPGRVDSVFSDANVMASYCVMVLFVQLGLAVQAPAKSWTRWGWGMAAGLTGLALVGTRSLNGLLVVWLLGLGLSLAYRRYGFSALLLLLGLAVVGAGWDWPGWRAVVPEVLWGRIPKYLSGQAEDPRTTQWQIAWQAFWQRPWWGWGLRAFPTLYHQATGRWVGHPHNLWVMLLVETGVWTTLGFTYLVGRVVVQAWRHWRQDPQPWYGAMGLAFIGVTLFHMLDVTLFDGRVNGLAWLLLTGLAGARGHKSPPDGGAGCSSPSSWE
ncbi:MAG: hypothetical protein RMI89_01095 [Gloeomargarita sp. SKYBB_i_bin120]|nr:hypothetical protein [Gloeomargarita sp. SKYB120]MDW8177118.1 hypothetical protein [Gloeomargarita sp. SKYBB_i_bin120]